MATKKQTEAARENIKNAQKTWQAMSSPTRARSQPEGRARAKPGSTGEGEYYHVEVRPKEQFTSFRTQDVGREGHAQRVAGRRKSGSWDTQKWLISKSDAHVENGKLVADEPEAKKIFDSLGSEAEQVEADRFKARPRRNIPEREKPTPAQRRARMKNIRKAQAVRRKRA